MFGIGCARFIVCTSPHRLRNVVKRGIVFLGSLFFVLNGCANPSIQTGGDFLKGQSSVVHASYYSRTLAGRKTASGERYQPSLFTAAHRHFPLGTLLRVTRLPDGPSVEVRVNDRCGCTHGRQIDLSEAAARKLGMLRVGVVKVRIEILGHEPIKRR